MRAVQRTLGCLLVVSSLGLSASPVRAVEPGAEIDPVRPGASPGSYLTLEGAQVTPHLAFFSNASVGYAYRPSPTLRVPLFEGGADVGTPVHDRATLGLWLAFGLFDVLQVGVGIPIVLGQTVEGFQDPRVNEAMPLAGGSGAGDLFFGAKARLFDVSGFALALALDVDVPTGQPSALRGELGAALSPRLVAEYRSTRVRVALGLGTRLRTVTGVLPDSRPLGSQGFATVAGGVRAIAGVWLMLEARGRMAWDVNESDYASFVELGGGALFDLGDQMELALSGGFGVPKAYGSAQARVGVEFRFGFGIVPSDRDADGVSDGDDRCPAAAETANGYLDDDGCAEPDGDRDGVPEPIDRCPAAAEDGEAPSGDGCPQALADRDEDGVVDAADRCPDQAARGGCPVVDTDSDGVPDEMDQCPTEPEITDGIDDEDGCPDAPSTEGDAEPAS